MPGPLSPRADLPEYARGKLYMLVEIIGADTGNAALYRQMLNAAQMAFYEEGGGSQAAALTRAVREAYSVLVRANNTLEANWRAGITLAALQGWGLTIAQAGPALCLVSHPKTVEQFPGDVSAWTQPFGGAERPDVKIFETRVEPGSMILLAQSDWLNHVTPEQLAVASTANNVGVAADYLGQIGGKADLSALVVFVGEPSAGAGGCARCRRRRNRRSRRLPRKRRRRPPRRVYLRASAGGSSVALALRNRRRRKLRRPRLCRRVTSTATAAGSCCGGAGTRTDPGRR